ncbi:glycosyltransferase family 4 protein [Roseovarius indicus]|uniref:glycosyltransferase family 4 protein n=1 Tax=Roseovarius indicus TaxID=540747 RepID=UPI0007D9B77B|nr:glycosyltransferase family 4 protein [Roseovarius indicus]OAO05821.1 hypothetical protein A8B76_18385 [Roseovarius indicus]
MSPRYLFTCPDSPKPSGGVAVVYQTAELLAEAGYETGLVHNSPGACHPDYAVTVPNYYTRAIARVMARYSGRLGRLRALANRLPSGASAKRGKALDLRPDDVIVMGEWQMPDVMEAFPRHRKIVYVQNPFAHVDAHARALGRGLDPVAQIDHYIGISDANMNVFDLLGLDRVSYFPVAPKLDLFPYRETKKKLVTYMPRKRPQEALVVDNALRARGRLKGYDLVAIDGVPPAKVAELLGDSLIFISFLKQEALGFPAAEAMSAGCITVGFTGFGTEEYFTPDTGVPTPEGDLPALVQATESVIAEYESSPARLDALRKDASAFVRDRYAPERFRKGLLEAWKQIETALESSKRT